jgi:hypothetical protein
VSGLSVRDSKRIIEKRRKKLERRLRRIQWEDQKQPMLNGTNIHYEVSEKVQAINCGGIGAIHKMVQWSGLVKEIDAKLKLLKCHVPYHESDHVLNMVYNILSGGKRLEDIELNRTNEAYMNALGTQRIPDPTTAGDFTRRFSVEGNITLMECINEVRKNLSVEKGELKLFDDVKYFFYITTRRDLSVSGVVKFANKRCDQENVIEQLKNGVNAMRMPVRDLNSNWAYMIIAALAWNIKAWYGLLMPDVTRGTQALKMEFRSFLHKLILVPCQIIKSGRKIIYRFLGYNGWLKDFFDTWELIRQLKYT